MLKNHFKIISVSFLILFFVFFFSNNFSSATTIGSSQTSKPITNDTLRNGLVGWWSMDGADTNATQVLDKSGGGDTGTRTAVTPVPGKIGQAMKFDGTTSKITITTEPTYAASATAISVSFWAYIDPAQFDGVSKAVIDSASGDPGNNNGLSIFADDRAGASQATNGLYVSFKSVTGGNYTYTVSNLFPTARWYHIVVGYSNTSVPFYIDGVSKTKSVVTGGSGNYIPRNANLLIGAYSGGGNFNFKVDDVRIYSRVISPSEITALYKLGQGKIASSQTAAVYGPSANTTLKTGLVGWWTMDGADTNATQVLDKSGLNNIGTRNAVTQQAGKIGQAMNFTGSNSGISISDANFPSGISSRSFSMWLKPTSASKSYNIAFSYGGAGGGANLYMGIKSSSFFIETAGVGGTSVSTAVNNKWYHVVWEATNPTNLNQYVVYINGVRYATSASLTVSTTLSTGNISVISVNSFAGLIDDVRIYNRALSATEITALYKLGQEKIASSQTAELTTGNNLKNGLVGWWTFDGPDTTATNFNDKAGTNNGSRKAGVGIINGKIGQAGNFDGVDDYVSTTLYNYGTSNTFSTWVKLTNTASNIIALAGTSTAGAIPHVIWYYLSGSMYYKVNGGAYVTWAYTPNTSWHHYAFSRNGTSVILYIDGISKGVKTLDANDDMSLPLQMGGVTGIGYFWKGQMDDVRAYNRALSASEIQQLYRLGR